jgi:hypothetical protein
MQTKAMAQVETHRHEGHTPCRALLQSYKRVKGISDVCNADPTLSLTLTHLTLTLIGGSQKTSRNPNPWCAAIYASSASLGGIRRTIMDLNLDGVAAIVD